MCGTTARMALKTPVRLVPIISCHASSESSHTRPVETIPAFAARMSICPNFASAAPATRATAAGSRTSAATAITSLPASLTSNTVSARSAAVPSWSLDARHRRRDVAKHDARPEASQRRRVRLALAARTARDDRDLPVECLAHVRLQS